MYQLTTDNGSRLWTDDGLMLDAPDGSPSLLRTVYSCRQITDYGTSDGLMRFADWLPLRCRIDGSAAPVAYRSEALAARLGLSNLWVSFSGYWPERGALMPTCSFKETEAYCVVGRAALKADEVLVVASAGNTARAFARVCSANDVPLLLCVPMDNVEALWTDKPYNSCVRVAVTPAGSDYADAIRLSNQICRLDGFRAEGGARNVARRDGMATTLLAVAMECGRIPDVYFQAVGSGTGAIAAWEASERLLADGRWGSARMRLCVSQNEPFAPIVEAWNASSAVIDAMPDARLRSSQVWAKVLANRMPPYSVGGGLFDALAATHGMAMSVSNDEARAAADLFACMEEIDICPAAAVAVASLQKAVDLGRVGADECVMLNITGGGEARFRADHAVCGVRPDVVLSPDAPIQEIETTVRQLFSH